MALKDSMGRDPCDLFLYLPTYRVLICKRCRYAIQPGAIARHLKDIHRLPSKERWPLVEYSKGLALDEPLDVVLPSQHDFPLPQLPVEPGWRCEAPGCEYLCVTEKRMEMHWSAAHRCRGVPAKHWSAVPLQTFFRGNMLRYFQGPRTSPGGGHGSVKLIDKIGSRDSQRQGLIARYRLCGVDVEALDQYFASTYNTFLVDESLSKVQQIWLEQVPALALQHRFLLEGMLASACLHLAYLKPRRWREFSARSATHLHSALPAFRHAIHHASKANCSAILAFAYLLLVVTMASDTECAKTYPLLFVRATDIGDDRPLLPQWLHFLRAGCPMLCTVWPLVEEGPMQRLVVDLASEKLPTALVSPCLAELRACIPDGASWPEREAAVYDSATLALAEALVQIRMSEAAASNGKAQTFNVLASWPQRLHDDALLLLAQQHQGMLILLARYCVIMKQLDSLWYFEERVATAMSTIERVLQPRWRPYIGSYVHFAV